MAVARVLCVGSCAAVADAADEADADTDEHELYPDSLHHHYPQLLRSWLRFSVVALLNHAASYHDRCCDAAVADCSSELFEYFARFAVLIEYWKKNMQDISSYSKITQEVSPPYVQIMPPI